MIYPFTRMVIYGTIWYQGEANADYNSDKYACSFSKLISYWRQIWNERTNGITNIEFPFGFVQVSELMHDHEEFHSGLLDILIVSIKFKCYQMGWRISTDPMASDIRCWLCSK